MIWDSDDNTLNLVGFTTHKPDPRSHPGGDPQVVSKLVQIREYISKASSMRDDLVEKEDVPANVERLSHLICHLKEQEKSYLRFLQKMLVSCLFDKNVCVLYTYTLLLLLVNSPYCWFILYVFIFFFASTTFAD